MRIADYMICAVQREAKQKFACEACSKKWVSGIAVSEACFCLQIDFYAFRYFDVILEDESSNFRREAKQKLKIIQLLFRNLKELSYKVWIEFTLAVGDRQLPLMIIIKIMVTSKMLSHMPPTF